MTMMHLSNCTGKNTLDIQMTGYHCPFDQGIKDLNLETCNSSYFSFVCQKLCSILCKKQVLLIVCPVNPKA